jgi:hypothetical protein
MSKGFVGVASDMKEYESRQDMLRDLVSPGATIAEIGVFAGDFAEWILKTLQPKTLYGVDPYTSTIGVMGSGNVDGYKMEYYELELLHGFVKQRLSSYPAFVQKREFSGDFFAKQDDGSLDAVYIDGDHSLEAVKADLTAARFAVKEGGWIFGHDYSLHPTKGNPEIKHVTQEAVDAFCQEHGLTVYALSNDGIRSFAIRNEHKYKICVVSLSDRHELYSKTFPLFHRYAEKHSYSTSLYGEVLDKERHPSWSKIPALKLALQENKYDYVVWMDDDIVITNPDISLSSFIDKYNFRKSKAVVLVSSDMPNEPSTAMNCGIFFVKAKEAATMTLLNSAWAYADVCPILKQNLSWEQEAFNFLYRFISREEFLIIPLPNFQATTRFQGNQDVVWKPGYFAAHLNNGPLPMKLMTFSLLQKTCAFLQ